MTNMQTIHLDIVSAEQAIYSGDAQMVFATGAMGELGISPGHTPLITALKPGNIRVIIADTKQEEIFYVKGGLLEVQPYVVTVLADTVVRADNIDEAAAIEAKELAEQMLANKSSEIDFAKANAELAEAIAQIRAVQRMKKHLK